jgi:hypothetical protein
VAQLHTRLLFFLLFSSSEEEKKKKRKGEAGSSINLSKANRD